MTDQLQLRHWQQIKQAQALEYAGTPEGNAALIESRRYGLAADRIDELAAQVEVMRGAIRRDLDPEWICESRHPSLYTALALPSHAAAILCRRDADVARDIATNWLPNVRRREAESSLSKTAHNQAVDDCVKHVLSYVAAKEAQHG